MTQKGRNVYTHGCEQQRVVHLVGVSLCNPMHGHAAYKYINVSVVPRREQTTYSLYYELMQLMMLMIIIVYFEK
jgi:hypothetical protein